MKGIIGIQERIKENYHETLQQGMKAGTQLLLDVEI